jgi:chromosome segregation ATPase
MLKEGFMAETDLLSELLHSNPNEPAKNGTVMLLRMETRSEFKALRSEMNQRFDRIEQIIGIQQGDIGTLKQDVSTLKQDVSTLKQDVSTLKQDVSTLKQDVSTLKQDVNTLKQDVSEMKKMTRAIAQQVALLVESRS